MRDFCVIGIQTTGPLSGNWRRSRGRNRNQSRMSAYDLLKIKNGSRKRSQNNDEIGVGRIRTFPFSSF